MRNLFQVNVEEGRHLWAMVYLLHAYFGRDGREEAEELARARRSGDVDKSPHPDGTFNEKIPGLALLLHASPTSPTATASTSSPSLAESVLRSAGPHLSSFMLTEEAHHMFVGETGIARIIQRTCDVMTQHKTDDPVKLRGLGVIDLPTIQKYLNFHFSVTSDLYGSEISSNAATFYTNGLKGRFEETKIGDDHKLDTSEYAVMEVVGDQVVTKQVQALSALNERLRDDWVTDVQLAIDRWNKIPEKAGIDFRLNVPHKAFHRNIGTLAGVKVSPDGRVVTDHEWNANGRRVAADRQDRAYVASLMGRVVEPGKFANWIAPPVMGINRQPVDFEYVRFN
jgi:benzoyl-CoA 2,3-epoxidase subunit B